MVDTSMITKTGNSIIDSIKTGSRNPNVQYTGIVVLIALVVGVYLGYKPISSYCKK